MSDIVERLKTTSFGLYWDVSRDAIAEITRLRQLLSEEEKDFERAWIIPGPGNEYRMLTRPPAGDEAPSVAIVYRTLLSEER